MPTPFKFDSCKIYGSNLNAAYMYVYLSIGKLWEDTRAEVAEQEQHLELLNKEYEHFKAMLDQTQQRR